MTVDDVGMGLANAARKQILQPYRDRPMPIELIHVFLGLTFLAVWAIAGAILIRQR